MDAGAAPQSSSSSSDEDTEEEPDPASGDTGSGEEPPVDTGTSQCSWANQTESCSGLQQDIVARTAADCERRCCEDETCEVWQFGSALQGCTRGRPTTADRTWEHHVMEEAAAAPREEKRLMNHHGGEAVYQFGRKRSDVTKQATI